MNTDTFRHLTATNHHYRDGYQTIATRNGSVIGPRLYPGRPRKEEPMEFKPNCTSTFTNPKHYAKFIAIEFGSDYKRYLQAIAEKTKCKIQIVEENFNTETCTANIFFRRDTQLASFMRLWWRGGKS